MRSSSDCAASISHRVDDVRHVRHCNELAHRRHQPLRVLRRAVAHGTEWAPERAAADERRAVYFGPEAGHIDTTVLSRQSLGSAPRAGPLLIQEYDTTIVVPPGCDAGVDEHGNVVIGIGGA